MIKSETVREELEKEKYPLYKLGNPSEWKWISYNYRKPDIGQLVICYNKEWVEEGKNPLGISIGYRTENDFISAQQFGVEGFQDFSNEIMLDDPDYWEDENDTISYEPEEWIRI